MTYEVYLAHHGIKGQKWGVRRYQNEDGSYTEAGKKRYAKAVTQAEKRETKYYKKQRADVNTRTAREQAEERSTTARTKRSAQVSARVAQREFNREIKTRRSAVKSLKKTEKYFTKQVKSLTKKGYKDAELDRFVQTAQHLTSQRELLKSSKRERLPGSKVSSSSEAMKKFLSTQASDAAKYQPSKSQEWLEYLWRKNPFRKDYY